MLFMPWLLKKNQKNGFHIAIEPDEYWGKAAIHNIEKAGLINYFKVERFFSDQILPKLYLEGYRIQYAYVDTTKRFDVVFQDCYFLDKMLDIGGVIILDDCGGSWPGVQRVARYMLNLPHYKLIDKTGKYTWDGFAEEDLKANPEKDYIYWPGRTEKVEAFEDMISEIIK